MVTCNSRQNYWCKNIVSILVTGNLGYLGTVLSDVLTNNKLQFDGLDCGFFEDNFLSNPSVPDFQIKLDIRKVNDQHIKKYNTIVHLAGLSNDPLGEFEKHLTEEINLDATVNLAKIAKKNGVAKFIYASSQSMYGVSGTTGELEEDDSEKNPVTSYAKTKWEAEKEIFKLADENFTVVALRFSTIFGSSPRLRSDIVYNNMLANAFTTKKIEIKSDGTPWRPVVHIKDACASIVACLNAPDKLINKLSFNVGIKNGNFTVNDIALAAQKIIPNSKIIYTNEHGKDSRTYKVSFKRIHSILKDYFKPQYDLISGGHELVDFFKKVNFKHEDLVGQKTTRLTKLKFLRDNNLIDSRFYFCE
jgi:nucleoside-diphosphate-sugar epimerase